MGDKASIDVALAIQLERLGPSAETWLNVQSAYDLWLRRHPAEAQPHAQGRDVSVAARAPAGNRGVTTATQPYDPVSSEGHALVEDGDEVVT